MPDSADILRLRVLLCFLKDDKNCNVMGISRILKEPKQTISRIMIALEKDGLLDRSEKRHPVLTKHGYITAQRYSERIEITLNHLLYEGVDIENAKNDAFYQSLYCSDETMRVIKESEQRYHVKYELRDKKQFGGSMLCSMMKNGSYKLPFLIYREKAENGTNISMANEGFEHPCILHIENGRGWIQLHSKSVSAKSKTTGEMLCGRIQNMQYFDSGRFISAEISGGIFSFPADALHFVNVGTGVGQILHGSVCLKMGCSVSTAHMPESTAIFTILI